MQRANDDEDTWFVPTRSLIINSADVYNSDEYPYASTVEGGSGSAIRCVAGDENSEGTMLPFLAQMITFTRS
jgi:hypothetical protein